MKSGKSVVKRIPSKRIPIIIVALIILALGASGIDGCSGASDERWGISLSSNSTQAASGGESVGTIAPSTVSLDDIPEYAGESYVILNDNEPIFSAEELAAPYGTEVYGTLDRLGRCTGAFAVVGPETEPTEKRQQLTIKPTGWKQAFYPEIGLDHLYERCHLLAHSLTAENDNPNNLVTGTHYMNLDGMNDFERAIDSFVDYTGWHVLMRVTPLFEGDELVCRGVQMEALSLEDNGDGIKLNIFCYNVQPGVEIDYKTGNSWLDRTRS